MKIKLFFAGIFGLAAFLFLPKFAAASVLFLNPQTIYIPSGQNFNIDVDVDTQGKAVNAVQANITFDPNQLQVVTVKSGSTFYLTSPGSPQQNADSVSFSAGVPTPGYRGSAGLVGSITFRPVAQGQGNIAIHSGHVFLNDGLGTDSLTSTKGAAVNITPPPVDAPEVSSATDPDQGSWYASSDLQLAWTTPPGTQSFSYKLDQDPNGVPDNVSQGLNSSKTYKNLSDGVWYFHIRSKGQGSTPFGAVKTFKIQIDTVAPKPFEIHLVGESDLKDVSRTPTIYFHANDALSGIGKYVIQIDDTEIASTPNPSYNFEKAINSGAHVFMVTAYDRAGNHISASLPVIISTSAISLQQRLSLPIYVLLLSNFILLLAVLWMIWTFFRDRRVPGGPKGNAIRLLKVESDLEQKMSKLRREAAEKIGEIGSTAEAQKLRQEIDREITDAQLKIDRSVKERLDQDSKES